MQLTTILMGKKNGKQLEITNKNGLLMLEVPTWNIKNKISAKRNDEKLNTF